MSNISSKKARSSAQILAEIAALPPSLRTLYKSNRLEQFFACLVRDLRQVDCAT